MQNRKLIVAVYFSATFAAWFISRAFLQWAYLTFYQIRQLQGSLVIKEVFPIVVAGSLFIVLLRHPTATLVLEDVISELKKVSWPSKDDVVKSTTVVLICVILASLVLFGIDVIWGRIFGFLLNS